MWIFLNDAMLSIVAHKDDREMLHVRARIAGDIERVFADAKVIETPNGDYQFRADIDRDTVAGVLADEVWGINYTNFKNSVKDRERHDVYYKVWNAMWEWQYRIKMATKPRRGRPRKLDVPVPPPSADISRGL